MKNLAFILLFTSGISFNIWQPDFEIAKQTAKEKHLFILLNFSGSDWCLPCIRMHKEIFENEDFIKMADTSLVMVNADFPRKKKNDGDKTARKQNERLADKYNPEGKFPYTVLLDADGSLIRSWDGFPNMTAAAFAKQINNFCNARK